VAGRSWTPGHHRNRGNVSGNPPLRVVDLIGSSMEAVVMAIPEVATRTGRPVIIVGGLAVICRLSTPYRATIDLDTVNRRHGGEPAQLEVLLASPGATASGPAVHWSPPPQDRSRSMSSRSATPTCATTGRPLRGQEGRGWHHARLTSRGWPRVLAEKLPPELSLRESASIGSQWPRDGRTL
jgi:hypothetical protein